MIDVNKVVETRAFQTTASRLAEEKSRAEGEHSFEEVVPVEYHCFKESVFGKKVFDELPMRRTWDHGIELIPGATLKDCKVYPLSRSEQDELDKFLDEHLKSGRIRPSKSPCASPFFFVKKKDGSLRPVQDYRCLNEMTIKNKYPLPLIQELIDKLQGTSIFTKLDIRWGYNNIRMKNGDEWKAAFRTNRGLFEPLVMYFGLCNSPATFQTMMNDLLKEKIDEGFVVVYMDDILIFTKDETTHKQVVTEVLRILEQNKLSLAHKKCAFHMKEIDYLGVVVSENTVKMDETKIKGVGEWPEPTNKREVQQFLGFCNFYRRFIKGFSKIAKPMTELTGKQEWRWGQEQKVAFSKLKNLILARPVLAMPNREGKFRVEVDASRYAIGAVLSQQQEDQRWRPVAFILKALSETERNYEIYDRELLAVMTALSEWRHYLSGLPEKFEVWTDHKNLEYFRKPQKLNRRQARWLSELQNYDFILEHKAGVTMGKADALSRRSDHNDGKNDNKNLVLLKPGQFSIAYQNIDDGLLKEIAEAREFIKEEVKRAVGMNDEWKEKGQVVTWKERIYV